MVWVPRHNSLLSRPAPPAPDPPHPPKQQQRGDTLPDEHLVQRIYFKEQTNDCKPKLLCRRRMLSLRNGLVFVSPPPLFGLVVGLSNWVRLLFGPRLLTASEFFKSTQDSCGLMRGSEPSEEIPYPQLYGPM